jgi:outer membrane protein assembly factor BamA
MILPDEDSLIKLRDGLIREYSRRGYPDAQISLRLETTDVPGQVVLIADINEGKPEKYEVILLEGLPDELNPERILKQTGLQKGIIHDDALVRNGISKLSRLLFELGYPDVNIDNTYSSVRIAPYALRLNITIHAGFKTELKFEGNNRLSMRELNEHIYKYYKFKTSGAMLESSVARLHNFAVKKGLLHTKIFVERHCHATPDKWYVQSINSSCRNNASYQVIVFKIDEGEPVEVEHIFFSGNIFFNSNRLKNEVMAFAADQYKSGDINT